MNAAPKGRLAGKNAIITGAAGYVCITLSFRFHHLTYDLFLRA